MKIVILGDCITSQNAGIHYFAIQWIKRVIDRYAGHEYTLVASEKVEELRVNQIIIPINKYIPLHLRWRQIFTIPRIVNKMNPDWVIEMAHFGPFAISKQIKRATVIHDLTPILFPQYHDWISVLMHKILLQKIIKRADAIITNSEWSKKTIIAYSKIRSEKIIVNYPTVELYNDIPRQKKGSVILNIGTIEPRKDQLTLIKAFVSLSYRYDDLTLQIIGKNGWRNNDFWQFLENLPKTTRSKITIYDYLSRKNVELLLSQAKIFVFPSLAEGFGMPILEAMSYGIPVVLSDISIHREVAHDAALYFNPMDSQGLEKKLENILLDIKLEENMSNRSHERHEEYEEIDINVDFLNITS